MFRPMQKLPFERPVYFARKGNLIERIGSVDEASYYLLHRWPGTGGRAHDVAREKCRRVLAKTCDQHEAREALIRALGEAGMDVME